MKNPLSIVIIFSILAGQLIRFSLKGDNSNGLSLLDLVVYIFCLIGFVRLKFQLHKPPKFIISTGLFILIAIASLIFTPLNLSTAEFGISSYYILRFSAYLMLCWLVYSNAFGNLKKQVDLILISSGVGLAILGLLQLIFLPDLSFLSKYGWDPHYFRTVSTFLDPNFAGAFFSLTLLLFLNKPITKKAIVFFVITYLALLTTFSRSSYLMFLVSGLSISYFNKSKKLAFKVILLFLILLLGFQLYTQLISKPRNIDREKSASLRISTWQQGWQLFSSHSILGIGFNSYKYAVKQYNLADPQFLQSHGSSSNDSSLLFVAATTGIIGLLSYIYFLFSLGINNPNNRLVTIPAILGLLIHSIFANSLFFPPILFWLLLISANSKK